MKRKEFIKSCSFVCMGSVVSVGLLDGCVGRKMVDGKIEGEEIIILESDFIINKKGMIQYRKFVIVHNTLLKFPIYVFRNNKAQYNAMLMECSHQGTELTAYGDILHCAAHGSEFNHSGEVLSGPAVDALKTFPVYLNSPHIHISLKKA